MNDKLLLKWEAPRFRGCWDLAVDSIFVSPVSSDDKVWSGSLLPGLWLACEDGLRFVKGAATKLELDSDKGCSGRIKMQFEELADGSMEFVLQDEQLRLRNFRLCWKGKPQPIISLHLGAHVMTQAERMIVPNLDRPFWQDWQAEGVCIPCAKTGPIQSFMRTWDLGHGRIALGNFAPAMGSPYGAAYPRPLLAGAMGGRHGWVVMGFEQAPDGALSFLTGASCAGMELLYREDLWGALPEQERVWEDFIKLCWAKEAVDAYGRFYYPEMSPTKENPHQVSMWSTWGDFKEGIYDLGHTARRVRRDFGVEMLVFDDPWETYCSSGDANYERFPDFDDSVEEAVGLGLKAGFWHSVGWLDRPEDFGLGKEDLLCGLDGEPRQCSWSFNPHDRGSRHYALDPSSPKARQFLIERTRKVLARYPVSLLKLDFYYGLPGPDVAVPRDPKYRGERLGLSLIEIIATEARRLQPDITILCYSLNPLIAKHAQLIALDDLGDASGREAEGHGQWSFWTTIAGRGGVALNGSSGYDWAAEHDVIMNSAIIGAPGGILPLFYKNGSVVPRTAYRPRRALGRWYRRTTGWRPLWLNSHLGDFSRDPSLRCWGRLETFDGKEMLTALALRELTDWDKPVELEGLAWRGSWVLIAQDNVGIFDSRELACIPVGKGSLELSFTGAGGFDVSGCYEQEDGDVVRPLIIETDKGVLRLVADDAEQERGLIGFVLIR